MTMEVRGTSLILFPRNIIAVRYSLIFYFMFSRLSPGPLLCLCKQQLPDNGGRLQHLKHYKLQKLETTILHCLCLERQLQNQIRVTRRYQNHHDAAFPLVIVLCSSPIFANTKQGCPYPSHAIHSALDLVLALGDNANHRWERDPYTPIHHLPCSLPLSSPF